MTNVAWDLANAAAEYGDTTAVIDADGTGHTYADLEGAASRIARVLREDCGVEQGDVVSAILPGGFRTVALMYGVMKLGAVVTIENPTLPAGVRERNLETVECSVLVVDAELSPDGPAHGEAVDPIEQVVRVDDAGDGHYLPTDSADDSGSLDPVARTADDLTMVNYTSGSTGRPKGVELTHGTLGASLRAVDAAYHDLAHGDRMLVFLPMYHTGGITTALFAVSNAATAIFAGEWDPDRALELTERYDIEWWYYLVPTMVRDLQTADGWAGADLTGVKTFLVGEPAPEEVHRALRSKGAETSCAYGMTETMSLAVAISPLGRRADPDLPPGSVGTPAAELGEVRFVDLETGNPVERPGESGEILFRGDNLTPGYYGLPDATERAIDDDGWFHTDDVGHLDRDGYLYVTGRADDVILSGGEKVSLVAVDDVLLEHPLVADAGSVGVPHERFGTVPAALVVPTRDVDESDLTATLDVHAREHLADWQRPRLYAIVEELPRTATKQTLIRPDLEAMLPADLSLDYDTSVTSLTTLGTEES